MQPVGAPGARHSGLASATIAALVNNANIAAAANTGKGTNESTRIA
jgi:hypothetical protein